MSILGPSYAQGDHLEQMQTIESSDSLRNDSTHHTYFPLLGHRLCPSSVWTPQVTGNNLKESVNDLIKEGSFLALTC